MPVSTGARLVSADAEAAIDVEIAVGLTAALDHEEVQRRVPEIAAQVAGADRATLLSLIGDELIVQSAHDRDGRPVALGYRASLAEHPVLAGALRKGGPIRGPSLDPRALPEPVQDATADVRHVLVLPLEFDGVVLGFLALMRRRDAPFDPTTERAVNAVAMLAAVSLRNARLFADLRTAQAATREFLDSVVHELRAPLTVAIGYATMLREGVFGETQEQQRQPLRMVDEKLAEAHRLVEELLLSARIENGSLPAREQEIDLVGAAQRAVDRAAPRAQLVGATVDMRAASERVMASTDEMHVDRILDNLINNAMVHGGDPARVMVTAGEDGTPFVSVSDHGPGVPAADRERIFKRFVRGGTRTTQGGSGLGLYLSRQLAQRNGGSLELDAAPQRSGARFVLRLPAARPAR